MIEQGYTQIRRSSLHSFTRKSTGKTGRFDTSLYLSRRHTFPDWYTGTLPVCVRGAGLQESSLKWKNN